MRLELERIPVWDGVKSERECYVCDLMGQAEHDALSFYLGPSVMNPETRIRVNEQGFCSPHWQMLVAENKPQGVSLMADTYLSTTRSKLEGVIDGLSKAKSKGSAKRAVKHFNEQLKSRERGCLVCSAMELRLNRYLYTTAYLWEQEEEFAKALGASKGFCLHHFTLLLKEGEQAVSSSLYAKFVREMTLLQIKSLDRIAEELHWMTQMYKSENREKDWNGSEDAHRRGVDKMVGRHRLIDPV